MIKIIIAPDSFKGSVSAIEAASSIEKGIKKAFPNAETVLIPLGDGGEGTMENLVTATNGFKVEKLVTDPIGRPIKAEYGILGNKETCIIEMACASGLNLINQAEQNPLETTTYGTGELIKYALDEGYRNFILAIGGSATNDGGAGMLQALGMKLLDDNGSELGFGGGELGRLSSISVENFDSRINESQFLIASDVDNPLIGISGASHIFGPQKGATVEMIKQLDKNLLHWANEVEKITSVRLHDLPGAGAAGGIGGAFQAFFPSSTRRGIDVAVKYSKLEEVMGNADLVITGEGQVDHQTAFGKTPMGVAQMAKKQNIPTIILAGSIGDDIEILYDYGVIGAYSIINRPMNLETAIVEAKSLLASAAEQVCRTFFSKC